MFGVAVQLHVAKGSVLPCCNDMITRLYSALAEHDRVITGTCYHPDAESSDPVFPRLDPYQVQAVWRMVLTSGTDLRLEFRVVEETANEGREEWDAWYAFSANGRKFQDRGSSTIVIKDGMILDQKDVFSFWGWSRQALGFSGLLLGWSSALGGKVRATAAARLVKAMCV